MVNNKVFGSLIDTYTVASEQEMFDNDKLSVNKIFDYSLNYGVVLGGQTRKLQPCLEHFLLQETEQVYQIVTKMIKPMKVIFITTTCIKCSIKCSKIACSDKLIRVTCRSVIFCIGPDRITDFVSHFVYKGILFEKPKQFNGFSKLSTKSCMSRTMNNLKESFTIMKAIKKTTTLKMTILCDAIRM